MRLDKSIKYCFEWNMVCGETSLHLLWMLLEYLKVIELETVFVFLFISERIGDPSGDWYFTRYDLYSSPWGEQGLFWIRSCCGFVPFFGFVPVPWIRSLYNPLTWRQDWPSGCFCPIASLPLGWSTEVQALASSSLFCLIAVTFWRMTRLFLGTFPEIMILHCPSITGFVETKRCLQECFLILQCRRVDSVDTLPTG